MSLVDRAYNPKYIKRFISNVSKQPTWKIKAIFDSQEDANDLVSNDVYLGYIKHRAEYDKEQPVIIQCYKCQKFGRLLKDCKNY